MPTESIVRAVCDAYQSKNIDDLLGLCTDEICYRQYSASDRAPYRADCTGKPAFVAALSDIGRDWDLQSFRIADIVVSGNRAATQCEAQFKRTTTGADMRTRNALFWTVKDGLVTEITEFYDTAGIADQL